MIPLEHHARVVAALLETIDGEACCHSAQEISTGQPDRSRYADMYSIVTDRLIDLDVSDLKACPARATFVTLMASRPGLPDTI